MSGPSASKMAEEQVHEPEAFVEMLRAYHLAPEGGRGTLANQLSDPIVSKRVDLAAVRQMLHDRHESDLLGTLDRLVDLIAPYIEEGGAEE